MFHQLNSKILKYLLLIGILLLPSVVLARVIPTNEFYVNDYANVITAENESYIINQNVALNEATKAQIVVVTVTSLDGEAVEEYATYLFRDFGIGDKDLDNGVLILVSTGKRQVRIEVGYGLEETLTDGKCGRILDNYMIPYLKNDDYDTAIRNGFDAVFNELVEFYGLDDLAVPMEEESSFDWEGLFSFLFLLFLFIAIIASSSRGGHMGPFIYFGGGSSSSGGGFSSGGFSGGGGSSGGGGASRGF